MHIPRVPHRWRLTPRQATQVQRSLAGRVRVEAPEGELRFVAGLDAAFSADGRVCWGAAVLWDRAAHAVLEERLAARPVVFPYVPGLLSFREAPALLGALRKLQRRPEVLMCDGQGRAHPRRFGIACHLGILCDLPSLGCAKSRLIGRYAEPLAARGGRAELTEGGEVLGTVLRTQGGRKPLFVSVGHKLDLGTAEALVLACAPRYRLPEPTRLADRLVARARLA